MPFIPVPNTVRVAINYTDNLGNEAVNVIHVNTDETEVTPAVIQNVFDVVEGWLATDWADVAGTNWTATLLEGRDLTTQNSFVATREVTEAGTALGENMPSQDTIAISLRTGFAGRSYRGRLYHVGLTENMVTGNYINGATGTALITAYDNLRTQLAAATYSWVVVSLQTNGAPRVQGVTRDIQDVVLADSRVDRQIRRMPGN